jgi:hypothetical protein
MSAAPGLEVNDRPGGRPSRVDRIDRRLARADNSSADRRPDYRSGAGMLAVIGLDR